MSLDKKEIGAKTFLYPMPVVLVGTVVNGQPNFLTIAYCGIAQHNPAMITVALGKSHYSNAAVRDNGTFSVNIPSVDMVKAVDYCGLYSGKQVDKSQVFEVFYGKLETAPLIADCPVNMECKLVQTVDAGGGSDIFLGAIVGVYAEDKYINNGLPDIKKIDPLVFSMHDNNYWRIGDHVAKAWHAGKAFRPAR